MKLFGETVRTLYTSTINLQSALLGYFYKLKTYEIVLVKPGGAFHTTKCPYSLNSEHCLDF